MSAYVKSLYEYYEKIKGKVCKWCDEPLTGIIEMYEHSGGYEIGGMKEKQWLYTECPKCEYQWAISKLI